MTKPELIDAITVKTGLTKKDIESVVGAFTDVVKETLGTGGEVSLVGFGTFGVASRAARTGLNPQTKQPIKIAAKKVPKFKAGKGLKDAVEAPKAKVTSKKK